MCSVFNRHIRIGQIVWRTWSFSYFYSALLIVIRLAFGSRLSCELNWTEFVLGKVSIRFCHKTTYHEDDDDDDSAARSLPRERKLLDTLWSDWGYANILKCRDIAPCGNERCTVWIVADGWTDGRRLECVNVCWREIISKYWKLKQFCCGCARCEHTPSQRIICTTLDALPADELRHWHRVGFAGDVIYVFSD